jgi:hypothetical protein
LRGGKITPVRDLATVVVCLNGIDIARTRHTKVLSRSRKICTSALKIVEIQEVVCRDLLRVTDLMAVITSHDRVSTVAGLHGQRWCFVDGCRLPSL